MTETDSITPRRSFRLRFSILNLLLISTIVAMGLVVWQQAEHVVRLRQYLAQAELVEGYLEISDRNLYFAKLLSYNDHPAAWEWRVWLPAGNTYQLCYLANDIPREGAPVSHPKAAVGPDFAMGGTPGFPSGEYRIKVTCYVKQKEVRAISVIESVRPQSDFLRARSDNVIEVRKSEIEADPRQAHLSITQGIEPQQRSEVPSEPLILLRRLESDGSVIADNGPPVDGLLIWIEPIDN